MKALLTATTGMLVTTMVTNAAQFSPSLIILNANVQTMDSGHPTAEAVAISGNRVVALGSTEEIRSLAGNETHVIDAAGRLLLPGFNDSHVHFLSGGSPSQMSTCATPNPRRNGGAVS